MKSNYDPVANHYDWLSKIIFRKNLILAQTCLLQHIPPKSNILIVGGGTGWILSALTKTYPSGLNITYVEMSEKMIHLAKMHNSGNNQVHFVHKAIEDYSTDQTFDIILTAFLFDNFMENKVRLVFNKLALLLNKNGKWLFADFHTDNEKRHWWQRSLVKAMYHFFRVVCHIEANQLVPVKILFERNDFRDMYSYERMYGLIRSAVYVRIPYQYDLNS